MYETIINAMAKAFFASAWAEMQDEKEDGMNLSGCEIMDVMPDEIDPAALHAAKTLAFGLSRANPFWRSEQGKADFGLFLELLYKRSQETQRAVLQNTDDRRRIGDRDLTPENFGHYLAMQAMGHGVGLRDAFGEAVYDAIMVPYVEFGSYSLFKDY